MARFLFVMVLVGLIACEPKPNDTDLLKNMIVDTQVDNTVNFQSFSTYKMPIDTMAYFSNTIRVAADTLLAYTSSNPSNNALVHSIVSEVKSKMDAAGYTIKYPKQSPDLWVEIYISENVTPTSDKATLNIYIYNVHTNSPIWGATIGDLVSTNDNTATTIIKAIDQAFAQSPYLSHQ